MEGSSSSGITHLRRRYDVFLSFRGPDARNTLANKLFQSLQQDGLHVFLDSERLEKGENIGMSLEEAIKHSRLHLPIFSPGYASSAWCLKELSLMWSCKARCEGSNIIPVFYKVEPWQVRYPDNEKSPYAEALEKHSKRHSQEVIEDWKKALHQVSSLSGWDLEEASGDEDKLVQQVREGLEQYINKDLHVAKHPVGLVARTIEVGKELLKIAVHQRRVTFGIWGMGGLGKTTFSKSIYNRIHHNFRASCFVADIRSRAKESLMGLRDLQKQILKNVAKCDVDFFSVDDGKTEMQRNLASIKVMVILDDVDAYDQLDALLGDWYGPGSIIIITTRDKELLQRKQVDKIQAMEGLSLEEGVKLFSLHAFESESPKKDYKDMTDRIVHACDGLPLSLEILGAHLSFERDLRIWEEALEEIQNVGYDKLNKSLRISYDALSLHEKQIFLDIACFFIKSREFKSKEFYVKFWKELGRKAVYTSLKNLEGKSLIVMHESTGNGDGEIEFEFRMHDHLRDLGRRIVDEESPDKPHMRSRLWREEDIISAIDQAEETSNVQGIMWNGRRQGIMWNGRRHLKVEQVDSLSSMRDLKFMFCRGLFLEGEITKLPQNLRYLGLFDCYISISEMPSSTESCSPSWSPMPKAIGQLKYLRYLHMSFTPLGSLPIEFGQLLCLEELYLIRCDLIELPHSFGNLIKLKSLVISRNRLKSFPANFSQLRSLEYLDAGQNEFEELPALPESLVHLKLDFCKSLKELPALPESLVHLKLDFCESLKELPALPRSFTAVRLSKCSSLKELPCMSHMSHLETLHLSYCFSLVEIPKLDNMHSLKELELHCCHSLEKLPALPRSLTELRLSDCSSLKELPCMSHMSHLETLHLYRCQSLIEIPKLDNMHSLRELTLELCESLEKLPALPEGPIHVSAWGCHKFIIYGRKSLQKLAALPEGAIHVSSRGCLKLQNNSSEPNSTDKRKGPVPDLNDEFILLDVLDLNEEIPVHDLNEEFILLDVREQSEVSEEGTSAAPEEIF